MLCRTIGIPARVATGYATGDYNILKNRYIVEERNAHAWVEVYWPDVGWVEFDPTPHTWFEGLGKGVASGWLSFHNAMEELYVYNPRGYFKDKVEPVIARTWDYTVHLPHQTELDFTEYTAPFAKQVENEHGLAFSILALACIFLLTSITIRQKRDLDRERRKAIRAGGKFMRLIERRLSRRGIPKFELATETDYAIQASGLSPTWGTAVASLVDRYQEAKYSARTIGSGHLRSLKQAGRAALKAPKI